MFARPEGDTELGRPEPGRFNVLPFSSFMEIIRAEAPRLLIPWITFLARPG